MSDLGGYHLNFTFTLLSRGYFIKNLLNRMDEAEWSGGKNGVAVEWSDFLYFL
jgi:hypothetical protein